MTVAMPVLVNGKERLVAMSCPLADVVEHECPGGRGVAVAVGGEVVPRGEWRRYRLQPGDRVEIVTAVQGG